MDIKVKQIIEKAIRDVSESDNVGPEAEHIYNALKDHLADVFQMASLNFPSITERTKLIHLYHLLFPVDESAYVEGSVFKGDSK